MLNNIMTKTILNDKEIIIFNNKHNKSSDIKEICFNNGFEVENFHYIILDEILSFINDEIESFDGVPCNEYLQDEFYTFIDNRVYRYYELKLWFLETSLAHDYCLQASEEHGAYENIMDNLQDGFINHFYNMFQTALKIKDSLYK